MHYAFYGRKHYTLTEKYYLAVGGHKTCPGWAVAFKLLQRGDRRQKKLVWDPAINFKNVAKNSDYSPAFGIWWQFCRLYNCEGTLFIISPLEPLSKRVEIKILRLIFILYSLVHKVDTYSN